MYNLPFFGFPYYRNYYRNTYNINKEPDIKNEKSSATSDNSSSTTYTDSSSGSSNTCYSGASSSRFFNSTSSGENGQPFINILGIDLYSDDILILCILLSLYMEGVKDEMLFISLILLLLS